MSKSGRIFDVAVPGIILVSALLYFVSNSYPSTVPFFETHFVASRQNLVEYRLWTLLTSLFYHHDFLHLFITTFGLITFGFMLENMVGSKWFMEYFLVSGFVGAMNHCMISPMLNRPDAMMFGATGPVTGIMILCALIYRNRTIWLLKVFPMKALWGATLFIGFDFLGLFIKDDVLDSPIGHGSHIAAALVGIIYYHKILRHRVWRNLQAAGEGQTLEPVQVTKLGWVLPCKYDDEFDDMVVFLQDMMGLVIADQGEPVIDTQINRFTKFKTPNGSLKLVEPNRFAKSQLYTHPMLSITVDNLANACRNMDSRQVKLVAPVYHSTENWAIVYFKAPDGRVYQIQGPYPSP